MATGRTALFVAAVALFDARAARAASAADELVRQAQAHEAAREDDLALRRYTEALSLDTSNADAWLGLGELRTRLGDPAEAERVYGAALARLPSLHGALAGRARARWRMGHHADAEADLLAYAEAMDTQDAYRQLAEWFAVDGRVPAQLATWRRLLALADRDTDARSFREASRMVRALVILADGTDPASSPLDADPTRRALGSIARRAR